MGTVGQHRGRNGNEVPDILFGAFVVAVAGVEMAVVLIILQRIERAAGFEHEVIGIHIRQHHARAALQSDPAGHLQRGSLQKDLRPDIVAPEQAVLNDPGGMGAVQGHEHLLFHGFKADGCSGRNKLGQLAVPARQNADGFLFDQLIGDIGFIRLQSRQGEIDLSLLQQPLQAGGGGLGQLELYEYEAGPVSLSGVGQVKRGGAAVKKRRTRFVLDLAQGLAQGGLADIELFCGGCDGSIFGNGFEIQGLLHIHIIFTTFLQHFHEIY